MILRTNVEKSYNIVEHIKINRNDIQYAIISLNTPETILTARCLGQSQQDQQPQQPQPPPPQHHSNHGNKATTATTRTIAITRGQQRQQPQ